MFHYFKIPYFTCTFFTKFIYNEYIGPCFLLHVVLRFSPENSPSLSSNTPHLVSMNANTYLVYSSSVSYMTVYQCSLWHKVMYPGCECKKGLIKDLNSSSYRRASMKQLCRIKMLPSIPCRGMMDDYLRRWSYISPPVWNQMIFEITSITLFRRIRAAPLNIVMDLNNVMSVELETLKCCYMHGPCPTNVWGGATTSYRCTGWIWGLKTLWQSHIILEESIKHTST